MDRLSVSEQKGKSNVPEFDVENEVFALFAKSIRPWTGLYRTTNSGCNLSYEAPDT